MFEVIHRERASVVLTPSAWPCLSRLPTINLTAGCAHGCTYCYSRSYSHYPGDGRVVLYTNTLSKLRDELARKKKPCKRVYFSPSSDLFQPVDEVLDHALEILSFLFEKRIEVSFLTKGRIPAPHMALLQANAAKVHAQVGVLSLDEKLLALFEPNALSPQDRLSQIGTLVRSGIATEARLDPILPGLTDDAATLDRLCFELARVGIRQIATSALFLRPAIERALRTRLPDRDMLDSLLSKYAPMGTAGQGGRPSVQALPASERRRIYERVCAAAERNGIGVQVCACENPDLPSHYCGIAGERHLAQSLAEQQELF